MISYPIKDGLLELLVKWSCVGCQPMAVMGHIFVLPSGRKDIMGLRF